MKNGTFKDLKLKQLSVAVENKTPVIPDRVGQRLKDIRQSLGMTQTQLARRLGVKQVVIARIEKAAQASSLKTLSRIAAAMGCGFMGTVFSERPLETMIRERAEMVAKKMIARTYANMALEQQHPGDREYEVQLKKLTDELAAKPGPALWED